MSTKGVFFDLGGTLMIYGDMSAAWSDWLSEFYGCMKRYGLSISKENFAEHCDGFFSRELPPEREDGLTIFERRIQTLCSELGVEIGIAEIRNTASAIVDAWWKYVFLDPDCHPVLEELQQHRTLGLISNFDHPPHLHTLIHQLDLAKFFTKVIISGDVGIRKPDPEIFHLALQGTGLQPDEVLYIGDTEDDIIGARAAGIMPIFLQRDGTANHGVASDFRADPEMLYTPFKADILAGVMVINSLPELMRIIE